MKQRLELQDRTGLLAIYTEAVIEHQKLFHHNHFRKILLHAHFAIALLPRVHLTQDESDWSSSRGSVNIVCDWLSLVHYKNCRQIWSVIEIH